MEVYVIERDGVNLPEPLLLDQRNAPKVVTRDTIYDGRTIDMPNAGRVELLVRADAEGTYTLRSVSTRHVADMEYPEIELARFVVSGSPVKMGIPKKLPPVRRDRPIPPSEVTGKNSVRFSEANSTSILPGVAYLLNGKSYDETRIDLSPVLGESAEWLLTNTSDEGHPFHLHTNSFEVFEANGVAIPPMTRDTIWIPEAKGGQPGSIRFRVRYKEWRGKDVLHCHILPHEDMGMMQNLMWT
jgi:FtsP/CotA-like multicopper oxidase with cupredoxin domain